MSEDTPNTPPADEGAPAADPPSEEPAADTGSGDAAPVAEGDPEPPASGETPDADAEAAPDADASAPDAGAPDTETPAPADDGNAETDAPVEVTKDDDNPSADGEVIDSKPAENDDSAAGASDHPEPEGSESGRREPPDVLAEEEATGGGAGDGAETGRKKYKKRAYYLPSEVALHNSSNDCWVSFLDKVYDITELLEEHKGSPLCEPLVRFAGKDVTHWFDAETKNLKKFVDETTNIAMYYTPQGRFIHVPPAHPSSAWHTSISLPWWQNDDKYCIGALSKKTRKIQVQNTLTHHVHTVEVCSEETIDEIRDRYLDYNMHAGSYTWKRLGKPLEMNRTLTENGIPDEAEEYVRLGLSEDMYIPTIHLYFNDDLSVA